MGKKEDPVYDFTKGDNNCDEDQTEKGERGRCLGCKRHPNGGGAPKQEGESNLKKGRRWGPPLFERNFLAK